MTEGCVCSIVRARFCGMECATDVLTIVSCSFSSNRSIERADDGDEEERDIVEGLCGATKCWLYDVSKK